MFNDMDMVVVLLGLNVTNHLLAHETILKDFHLIYQQLAIGHQTEGVK